MEVLNQLLNIDHILCELQERINAHISGQKILLSSSIMKSEPMKRHDSLLFLCMLL